MTSKEQLPLFFLKILKSSKNGSTDAGWTSREQCDGQVDCRACAALDVPQEAGLHLLVSQEIHGITFEQRYCEHLCDL